MGLKNPQYLATRKGYRLRKKSNLCFLCPQSIHSLRICSSLYCFCSYRVFFCISSALFLQTRWRIARCFRIWLRWVMLEYLSRWDDLLTDGFFLGSPWNLEDSNTSTLVKRPGDCHRSCSGGDLLVQETRMSKAIIAWRRLHLLSISICASVRTCATTCFGAHGRLHCCSSETWLYTPGLEYSKLGGHMGSKISYISCFFAPVNGFWTLLGLHSTSLDTLILTWLVANPGSSRGWNVF